MLALPHRLAIICMVLVMGACRSMSDDAATDTATAPPPAPAAASSLAQAPIAVPASDIDQFAGYWLGTTAPRGEVLREATVIVEPEPDEAFTITWKNFAAADDGSGLVLRERTLTFVPTDNVGVWRAEGSGDPVETFSSWATMAGTTLSIDVVAVGASGRLERQSYHRTISGDEMALVYTRRRDGSDDLVIEGSLLRLSED